MKEWKKDKKDISFIDNRISLRMMNQKSIQ